MATYRRIEHPLFQAYDTSGDPLSGGLVYTYAAGTDTPKTTYDADDAANDNPVVLDSTGRAEIYGTGYYKFILKTAADVTIWTLDNVQGIGETSIVDIGDYAGDFDAAITAISTTATTLYVDSAAVMSAAVTVPATCAVIILKGGSIDMAGNALTFNGPLIFNGGTIDNDAALTMNGPVRYDGSYAALDSTSYGTFGTDATREVYPEMWGANTTPGTTDMTAAIQAAINSITAGTVLFCGEIYLISSPLVPESNVNLKGIGGAIIKLAANSDDDMVDFTGTDTDITIDGIAFDGNGTNQSRANTVNIICASTQVKRLTITNCKFSNSAYNSIRLAASLAHEDVIITENRFYDYDRTAIQIYGTVNLQICNNILDNDGATLTDSASGISIATSSSDSVISDNIIFMDDSASADSFGITVILSDRSTVSNNIIKCNAGSSNGGISIDQSNTCTVSGNSIYQPGNIAGIEFTNTDYGGSITGNTIENAGVACIALNNDNANVSITGNSIYNHAHYGIAVQESSGTYTNTYAISIIGNTLITGTGTNKHSIYCTVCPARDAVISGNVIANNASSIGINLVTTSDTSKTMTGVTITGNSIYNCSKGLSLSGTDHTNHIITGNTILGCAAESTFDGTKYVIKDNQPDVETLTGAVTLNRYMGAGDIDSTAGAVTGTLGSGYFIGQIKTIVMTEDSNSSTVSITNHQTDDPEVATFDAVDETGVFMWTGTEWITIFATCTFV